MSKLELKTFEADSFLGIDRDKPVVIDFTKSRKKGVITLSGDQGTGKTSTLTAIMTLMGAAFSFDTKDLYNQKDDAIDIKLEFNHDGVDYEVTQVGNRLVLRRFYKETERWIAEGSPKETLRKIFGNLGVSPMFLKELSGKKQIQWFRDTFGAGEEVSKKEAKIESSYKQAFNERRDVNRAIKDLHGWLNENNLYKDYEKNQKKFAVPITLDGEKNALDAATEKKKAYDKAMHGLDALRDQYADRKLRIANMQKELAALIEQQEECSRRISDGEKYLKNNAAVEEQYNEAFTALTTINKKLSDQKSWKEVLTKEKELHQLEDASQAADASIDKLRKQLLDITATYLPAITGLEIRTKQSGIDNGDEDEGIYWEGLSLAQLSESELLELFLLIWEEKEVQFVFIENLSSFGSGAVETLNRLVKEKKAQIFASEMDRTKNEMQIAFTNVIS